MMKINFGSKLALYPTPVGVIGAKVNGKNTYTLVAHFGIVSHSHVLVSLAKNHYINQGIKESKILTINLVDKDMLAKADYCGSVSGNQRDKSDVFLAHDRNNSPIIDEAPLTLECQVDDIYEIDGFDNFICKILGTYVDEKYLTEDKKNIDYTKFKPVLFEFPTYEYLETGAVIAKCLSLKKK